MIVATTGGEDLPRPEVGDNWIQACIRSTSRTSAGPWPLSMARQPAERDRLLGGSQALQALANSAWNGTPSDFLVAADGHYDLIVAYDSGRRPLSHSE